MTPLATIVNWIIYSAVFAFECAGPTAYASNPCTGKGTVIVFVNGLFDNLDLAKSNLDELQNST